MYWLYFLAFSLRLTMAHSVSTLVKSFFTGPTMSDIKRCHTQILGPLGLQDVLFLDCLYAKVKPSSSSQGFNGEKGFLGVILQHPY